MTPALAEPCTVEPLMASAWNGERFKKIREAAGHETPRAFALAAGYQPSTIGRWESGERVPGSNELFAIATFLNVSCEEFRKPLEMPVRFKPKPKD